jgi:hypothetical protein
VIQFRPADIYGPSIVAVNRPPEGTKLCFHGTDRQLKGREVAAGRQAVPEAMDI